MSPKGSKPNSDFPDPSTGPTFRDRLDSLTRGGAREALQHLRQSLRVSQKKGNREAIGWSLLNIAMVMRAQRDYPAVIKILEEARGMFTASGNDFGLASVYTELSFSNRELDRNALALEYAHKAVSIFQALGRPLELAWAYDNLAVIYFNRFQRHESLTYAKRARAIFQEFNSSNGLAWNACNMANLYLEMGFFKRATRYFTEAHGLFSKLNSKQGRAWSLLGLATITRAQCKFKDAESYLEKAKGFFAELELKDRVGWCLLNLAAIKRLTGKEEDALALNKKAVQLFGPLRNHDGVAWGFFQIGQIHRDRGQLVKAWQTLREALNLHTDISNRAGMGWAENEIGKTYLELNDEAHARESLTKAETAAAQLDALPLKAEVCKNLAHLCMDEGQIQKALELLNKADAGAQKIHSREIEADVLLARARYWTIMGDVARARAATQAAKETIENFDLHRLKPTLGVYLGESLLAQGKVTDAVEIWQETVLLAKKMRQRRQRAEALLGLIEAQRKTRTPAQISLALFHVEKEIRAIGSRKLRAKFVLLKGLIAIQNGGAFDIRFVTQATQIAGSAGLKVLERVVLETALQAARAAKKDSEAADIERDLTLLLQRSTPDLGLVQYPSQMFESFPVSVIL